ncbi:hypothetical protein AXF42_Ash003207 [Apostasia shenzhenica]|uniref:UV-B-induced protein n=1 Tax=Apostasia shenzhenica TaxID=1088818 RepID=A0A2I0BFH1_9ASPA|nr:hypothetical protein AXF42_Ash003207 [Apostasia shenzhenica]
MSMEAAGALRPSQFLAKAADFAPRSCFLAAQHPSIDGRSIRCGEFRKGCCLFSGIKLGERRSILTTKGRKRGGIRASWNSSSGSSESCTRIAPLQLESPIGQFLAQILLSHPHLVPAAVEKQLEQLLTDREAENSQEEPSSTGTDLMLYRRIAELKAKERKKALEEIVYALVVQKFVDADVSLVPSISQASDDQNMVDHWPSSEDKFERLHSPEAYEMIKSHLSVILGSRLDDSSSIAAISKLRVGQAYAASILYGYFLKRVDQRFQLEKTMKTLPWGSDEEASSTDGASTEASSAPTSTHSEASSWTSVSFAPSGFADRIKPCRLRTYVMSLDSETLQRFASVRSKEAFSIIEKHTEALFGRPEVVIKPQGTVDSSKDEIVKISFTGLKRLILEAVTFGSFLWDVESFVDSRYHFVSY